MADIDLKTETPDTTLPTTGFLFGADSQAAASPSVYSTQTVATTLLGSTSLTGATVTTSSPVLDLSQTWNDGAVTFTGLRFNAAGTSDANSASASLLMDLQVGGASRFSVRKDGVALAPVLQATSNVITSSGNFWAQGSAAGLVLGSLSDARVRRRGAANVCLGAADAAAPVAQTLSVQSVVAGTTDTAGANLTITGSQGTGTGAGGSIIFQVAPAGSTSNSVQNALVDALTINADRRLDTPRGIINSTLTASGAPWFILDTANTFKFQLNGGERAFLSTTLAPFANGMVLHTAGINLQTSSGTQTAGAFLTCDAANTLALRNGANAQESRVYGSYTSATNFQRMSIKTLRESSGALSGASYTTTIAIPAYANLIGVTTRVTTEVTGATTYDVGDGTDVDLWGAAIGVALGSQSRTADFTAVAAVGAAATSRTVTLTANGSNFTGGVVEICLHYLTTEAD